MLFIIIAIVSFLFLAAIIADQIINIRRGIVDVPEEASTLAHKMAPKIENTALGLTLVGHRAGAGLYLQLLLVLKRLVRWFKILLHKLEVRVSSLISAAHVGRVRLTESEIIRERGSVSFFLAQIKDHKDDLARRAR